MGGGSRRVLRGLSEGPGLPYFWPDQIPAERSDLTFVSIFELARYVFCLLRRSFLFFFFLFFPLVYVYMQPRKNFPSAFIFSTYPIRSRIDSYYLATKYFLLPLVEKVRTDGSLFFLIGQEQ